MGASLLFIIILLFHSSYSDVVKPQTIIAGVCELNQIRNSADKIIALERTSKCNCRGYELPSWVLPSSEKLERLDIPNCGFSGQILKLLDPSNDVLSYINVEANEFTETIPPFITQLHTLTVFDISNNNFFGGARFDTTGSNFVLFDVSHNKLTGSASHFMIPDRNDPELRFYIGGNIFDMSILEPVALPSILPSYLNYSGIFYGRPQLSCIVFTRGYVPPTWCNLMGESLCACKDLCGNGFLERSEQCEISGSNGPCCDKCSGYQSNSTGCPSDQACVVGLCNGYGSCVLNRLPNTTICRPAISPCDVPEYCTGFQNFCPTDRFAGSSVLCRPKDGECDVADYCTGTNASCPVNKVMNTTVLCRTQNGTCDVAEFCDGIGTKCPNNTFLNETTVCRAANGTCDAIEFCTGVSGECPANVYLTNSTMCRAANGTCDADDYCTGTLIYCPDTFAPPTVTCRVSTDVCDSPELCPGNSADCPPDMLYSVTQICRSARGDCDNTEYCDGIVASCAPDTLRQNGTICRSAVSLCDLPEVCDGTNVTCPSDLFQTNPAIVCREVNGSCDIRETCTGLSPLCPNDTYARGDVCRPVNGTCDNAEICTGNSPLCPRDTFFDRTTVCRDSRSICDITEFCTGTSPECPFDMVAHPTVVCRPANMSCDIAENCDGISPECPTDIFQPTTLVCRGSSGLCDTAENCTGDTPSCPPDSFASAEIICRNSIFPCDATEYCTGNSASCPPDSKSNSSHVCRAPKAPCDAPEYCSGTSLDCPPDLMSNSSTICRDSAGTCDKPEYCNGTSIQCPADLVLDRGVSCRSASGTCDVEEICNGTSPLCPPDKFRTSSGPADTCLPALGNCGPAQYCDGTRPACPDRVFIECPGGTCNTNTGACFCADNTTVYPECKEFCGDNMCNQGGLENCVNCPSDCRSPCNLCGDGLCTSQLAESCDSCYSDCSRTCPSRRCSRPCVNGQCWNGRCECYGSFYGPTCSEKPLRVDASPLGGYPAIVAIVTFPSGDRKRYTIALTEIVEETSLGNIVKSLAVPNVVFDVDYVSDGISQTWTFSKNIPRYGKVTVYITYAAPPLHKRVVVTANTFMMQVNIESWAFAASSNNLQLITENTIETLDLDSCSVEKSVYGNSLEWFLLHHEDVGLYYQMAQIATLDGYPRYVTNGMLTDANTITYVPFFWYNLSLYNNFGFIPYSNFTGCDASLHKNKEKKWEPYLAIPAVIIFLIIIFLVIMCVLRPTRCFRRRRNVPSFDSKHPMVDPKGSEMVILPPPPPPAAPEPQSPPPPPPPHEPWQDTRHLPVDPRMYAPPSHMSYAPPPSSTSQSDFGRPMHASAPYPQFTQQESHHNLLPPPAPSAPMPSPDGNQNYMPDE